MAGSEWSGAIAVAAFVASYVGLGLGRVPPFRVDRTGVAIIGATLMVVSGALPWPDAVAAVDAPTLVLLFGMMIVTGYLRLSGFFRLVMTWALRRARAPLAVLGLGCVFLVVWLVYRRQLPQAPLAILPDARMAVHYPLMLKTIAAVSVMLVLFLAGVPIAIVAIAGAGSTLLTRRVKPEKVYREVNWGLLVLFAGLFVITAGLERSGIMDVFLHWAAAANLDRPAVLTVVAAVLSNLVSNVPAVLLVKPLVASFAEPRRAWLVLAMASTLAGNLTILGSVANLIVVETARAARVEIGFVEYAKVGVPLTLVTLLLGWLLLAFARV